MENFCKLDNPSKCGAGESWDNQQRVCRFSAQAAYEKRCMYFVMGEFCDCLKAQMDAENPPPTSQTSMGLMEIPKELCRNIPAKENKIRPKNITLPAFTGKFLRGWKPNEDN